MLRFFKYLLPHWLFVLEANRRAQQNVNDRLGLVLKSDDIRFQIEANLIDAKEVQPFNYKDVILFFATARTQP